MIRLFLSFIFLALLIYGATWFAQSPGTVTVEWLNFHVDTSFSFLLSVVLLFSFLCALAYRLWRDLWHFPAHAAARWRDNRRRKGYRSLTQGLVALAAGDAQEAERHARRAVSMKVDTPLTLLLSAQAAQMKGDDAAAGKFFTAMLEDPQTSFLALRGLAGEALRLGKKREALGFIERARKIRPDTAWALSALFDLYVRDENWDRALETLDESVKAKALSKEEGALKKAVLYLILARAAQARGADGEALKYAQRAEKCAEKSGHGLIPVWVDLARYLKAAGKVRRARNVIHKAWARRPHGELAEAYAALVDDEEPLARMRRFVQLSGCNPGHRQSHLALARCALDAGLWGETRKHLDNVMGESPSKQVCLMMAELEEKGAGNQAESRKWLERAALGDGDPVWVCTSCGRVASQWTALCKSCHGFASLDWQVPGSGGAPDVFSAAPAILAPP